MVYLSIYNTDLEYVGGITQYTNLIWTDRFYEAGDFELTVPYSDEAKLIQQDYYITSSESEHFMIIEQINYIVDSNNCKYIKCSGRSGEALLARRIVWKDQYFASINPVALVQVLLRNNVIWPEYQDSWLKVRGMNQVYWEGFNDLTRNSYTKKLNITTPACGEWEWIYYKDKNDNRELVWTGSRYEDLCEWKYYPTNPTLFNDYFQIIVSDNASSWNKGATPGMPGIVLARTNASNYLGHVLSNADIDTAHATYGDTWYVEADGKYKYWNGTNLVANPACTFVGYIDVYPTGTTASQNDSISRYLSPSMATSYSGQDWTTANKSILSVPLDDFGCMGGHCNVTPYLGEDSLCWRDIEYAGYCGDNVYDAVTTVCKNAKMGLLAKIKQKASVWTPAWYSTDGYWQWKYVDPDNIPDKLKIIDITEDIAPRLSRWKSTDNPTGEDPLMGYYYRYTDRTNYIAFSTYSGWSREYENGHRAPVIFSENLNNMNNSEYVRNMNNWYTSVLCGGADPGDDFTYSDGVTGRRFVHMVNHTPNYPCNLSSAMSTNIGPGGSFPTQRIVIGGGKTYYFSLVDGDWVTPNSGATYPFTIGSCTFTGNDEVAVYDKSSGTWTVKLNVEVPENPTRYYYTKAGTKLEYHFTGRYDDIFRREMYVDGSSISLTYGAPMTNSGHITAIQIYLSQGKSTQDIVDLFVSQASGTTPVKTPSGTVEAQVWEYNDDNEKVATSAFSSAISRVESGETDSNGNYYLEYPYTSTEYDNLLKNKAYEEYSKITDFGALTCEADPTETYKYGEQYFIGDTVSFIDFYGNMRTGRVIEYITSASPDSGVKSYPTITIDADELTSDVMSIV